MRDIAVHATTNRTDDDTVDLDELANFLNSDSAPPGCMDLSELDGFLAGLIAGPEVVPPHEWLAEIWDDDEPSYEDPAEKVEVERAILDRYNGIRQGLEDRAYTPILWVDDAGTTVAEDWAAGFMQAVSLRSVPWHAALADDDASALLIPIASLAGMTLSVTDRGEAMLDDDALEALARDAEQVLPVCVLGLWRFWQDRQTGRAMTH